MAFWFISIALINFISFTGVNGAFIVLWCGNLYNSIQLLEA